MLNLKRYQVAVEAFGEEEKPEGEEAAEGTPESKSADLVLQADAKRNGLGEESEETPPAEEPAAEEPPAEEPASEETPAVEPASEEPATEPAAEEVVEPETPNAVDTIPEKESPAEGIQQERSQGEAEPGQNAEEGGGEIEEFNPLDELFGNKEHEGEIGIVAEIKKDETAMSDAVDIQASIESYIELLKQAGDKGISRQSAAFMQVDLARIDKALGTQSLGLESFNASPRSACQQTTISLEGLGDKLKAVGSKAVEIFEALWAKLMEFYGKVKEFISPVKEKNEALAEVGKVVADLAAGKKVNPEVIAKQPIKTVTGTKLAKLLAVPTANDDSKDNTPMGPEITQEQRDKRHAEVMEQIKAANLADTDVELGADPSLFFAAGRFDIGVQKSELPYIRWYNETYVLAVAKTVGELARYIQYVDITATPDDLKDNFGQIIEKHMGRGVLPPTGLMCGNKMVLLKTNTMDFELIQEDKYGKVDATPTVKLQPLEDLHERLYSNGYLLEEVERVGESSAVLQKAKDTLLDAANKLGERLNKITDGEANDPETDVHKLWIAARGAGTLLPIVGGRKLTQHITRIANARVEIIDKMMAIHLG